ncbi:restriction endonuclease subunit S [Pseudoalteromonas sp. JSTW]|uniref:restriction endonuclease subunit S n=1 Tax=Pseudoalteromonas sp. JSTW TaxID=2752475 RepID=UPI00214C4B57|nr:restriction endonuclease subunit S [Pseudoalteromonas sp. JSTW]
MNELPKGWLRTEISNVATVVAGGTPKASDNSNFAEPGEGVAWLTPADLSKYNKKTISRGARDLSLKGLKSSSAKLMPKGTILFSSRAPIGYCVIAENEIATNQGFKNFVLSESVDSSYAYYYLKSIKHVAEGMGTGTTFKELSGTVAKTLPFLLAPLTEQVRIANKLDSILAKVNKAQSRLDKIPSILKRFRQSVFAAATSGELTREWREDDGHQWRTVQLKDVGKGFNYGSSAKSKPEGDVPVLRMGNLQGGKLDWSNLVFTSDEAEIEKYLLETGDILFNRTNSPELVGKTSIYRGEQKAIYAGYLIRVKGSEQLNTEFLNIQLNSPHARDYCWQVKTDGVSQSNINAKKLQAYEFDLPPMSEQLEIVRRVNELFSRADLFERQYLDARKAFNRLTQSILAKAFRGELVAQDPNDEPASELLENIKKQRLEIPKQVRKKQIAAKKEAPQVKNVVSTPVKEKIQPESEVLSILKNASDNLSAQQIIEQLSGSSFEQVDMLFTDIKKLLDSKLITKIGSGERCTFKVVKK